jgi:hypothetical protein
MEAKFEGCVYCEETSARLRLLDLPNVLLYEILMRSFQLDYPIEPNFWKILNSLAVGNIAYSCTLIKTWIKNDEPSILPFYVHGINQKFNTNL